VSFATRFRCLPGILLVALLAGNGYNTTLLTAASQPAQAIVQGRVFDSAGQPLVGANVILKEIQTGVATDQEGAFRLTCRPGHYTLEITYIGYHKISQPVDLPAGRSPEMIFRLVQATFEIGGIVVIADQELIPAESETKTRISAGEIEHLQASSLSDVLKLVPGQRFDNPGLQENKQVQLRTSATDSDADRNAFFGTQIIIDNVPLSNNANMQLDTKANTGTIQRTTENSGIDLRQIPADNIEAVEVIRGIPPARYGDLTSGVVKVTTRTAAVAPRIKIKYNPANQEANFNSGFKLAGQEINLNLNYARSVRDIRIPHFDYSRAAGQLSLATNLWQNLLKMENRLYLTRTFDEQGLRRHDLFYTERYNRDALLRWNHHLFVILSPDQRLEFSYAYTLNRQNSYRKTLISTDNTYVTDRMTEGTQTGFYVQNYISRHWVKGQAQTHFATLDYTAAFTLFGRRQKLAAGFTWRSEKNNGPGRIFDPAFPPVINSLLRDRPRSYNDLPALVMSSFYVESQVNGQIGLPFQLNSGLRTETYGNGQQGSYINPRLNGTLFIGRNTQLRCGYGVTSKAPSLSMLYPNLLYFDIDDINRYTTVDSTRLVVVSTYIYNPRNPDLKGFQQYKRELSLDQQIGPLGLTLTGYTANTFGGIARTGIGPVFQYCANYPDYPDLTTKIITDSVFTTYDIYENSQNARSHGVELSLQTRSLTAYQMRLRVEGAYNYTYSWKSDYDFGTGFRFDPNLRREIKPFWNIVTTVSQNLLINYRLEFKMQHLKAWVTFEAQQVVFDKDRYRGLTDSLAVGFLASDGTINFIPATERSASLYANLKRVYPDYYAITENRSNIWLFNLRVSKALWRGSEVSFFVNNMFNSHPLYRRKRTAPETYSYTRLNPDLFFGIEASSALDYRR